MDTVNFKQISLEGEEAGKFLQSQLTVNTLTLDSNYQPAAIANLKGRIEFGIWVKKQDDNKFDIVISSDCLSSLQAHLNKYGAFSKFTTTDAVDIYPCIVDKSSDEHEASFSQDPDNNDPKAWMAVSIATGNYWIVEATQAMFQPQELRLHQRGGVDYDKGCYLGQEVIARIYFKAAPKAFLHRVKGHGETPKAGDSIGKIKVVNAISTDNAAQFEALVVARPNQLEDVDLEILELPAALQGGIGRADA